jgi:pimeloyl-ACP methyl ester carboxylesterase
MGVDADIKNVGTDAAGAVFTAHPLKSSFDGVMQPMRYWQAAEGGKALEGRPAVVFLHSWSTDWQMDPGGWFGECVARKWSMVMPDFRGPNNNPMACASAASRADVLDAADFALDVLKCDPTRVYLAGGSGGAYMAMVMAGHAPRRFTAMSAWCGVSDVGAFYDHHNPGGVPTRYAKMVIQCMGGAPGESAAADKEYWYRSPKHHLQAARDLPFEFAHGVRDGKPEGRGVVCRQTIDGFNVVARANGAPEVTEAEMAELWNHERLLNPKAGDTDVDGEYEGRAILMRRHAGASRLTIFDGGHDGLAYAGCQFLSRFAHAVERR